VLRRHDYQQWSAVVSNGQQSMKLNILAQCKASNYLEMTQPFLTKMQ